MLKATDVADFFVYLMQEEENELTNLKLNKLVYFAQGHSLKRYGRPLFSDDIQAWKHGPVVADVYHKFKDCQRHPITEVPPTFGLSKYSEDEKTLLVDVAREYGRFTGQALRNMTHQADTPWSRVYDPEKKSTVIRTSDIREYFDKQPGIELGEIDFPDDAFIGYRDSDGYLVLPSEYDD